VSFIAVAIGGGVAAAGSIASAAIGANASSNAAGQEVSAQKQALQQTQTNQQPFLDAGTTSIKQLMSQLNDGTFGAGSIAPFTAPTAAEAAATPGYQFTQQQGDKGILEGAAASGGAISGGALKSLDQYNTGLADSTYSSRFSQSLQTYQAALQGQQQAYNQTYQPAALGEAAVQNTNASLSQILGNIGQSQAAGTVGTANAVTSGIGQATNGISQSLLLSQLLQGQGGSGGGNQSFLPAGSPVTKEIQASLGLGPG
jgi:hypothetical protein